MPTSYSNEAWLNEVFAKTSSLSSVALSGTYSDLIGKPSLFDGIYSSLTGKPVLFDGAYASLSGKPSLFDGIYASLTGKPTLGTAAASAITDFDASGAAATAQSTAISTASSDATTKANAAQSAAIAASAQRASNLSDLVSASSARTNLGLGSLATQSGTFSGTSSGTNTGDQTAVSGSAGTLSPGRTINGTAFDGSGNITIAAAAGTLTGATLASGVTASSLTSFGASPALGTPASGTLTNCSFPTLNQNTTGSAAKLTTARTINGTSFDGTGNITVSADASTLTAATLASGVTASSLTSFGASIALGTPASGVLTNCTFPTLNQNTSGSAASLTTPRTIGGTSFNGTANITVASATGGFTVTGGSTVLAACTASTPSLNIPPGTIETAPAAGDMEFDGVQYYATIDTTSKRGAIPVEQYFHLTSDGSNITTTIANFFGSTSNISLVASAYYDIEILLVFLKTTTEILTITLTNSAAPTSQNIRWQQSPITGMVAPPGTATCLVGFAQNDATAAKVIAAGSLTTAVNHYIKINIQLKNGTGTSLKIQATNPAGSITPRLGSYWKCRRISPNNIGVFAA